MNIDSPDTVLMPATPSLRGRIATRLVRVVVKRWARGDPPAVVRRARRVFGLPNFLGFFYSRGLEIERVETDVAAGVQTGATQLGRRQTGGAWGSGAEAGGGQIGEAQVRGAEVGERQTDGAHVGGECVRGECVRGEWIRPRQCRSRDRVLLYFHGGGYVSCSPETHRPITAALARLLQCPVFAVDYRLAPEHPFPAAVDDAAAAFQWLVAGGVPAEKIALAGDSAGGGLVLAAMLRLRALGHRLPACEVGLSPWVDLSGADKYRNAGSCSMFQPNDIATFAKLYLDGAPATSPEASPLFGDLRGLPPLLIHVSSTELLLDDAVRLHEKAASCGVKSALSIYPGLPHVWHLLIGVIPEARQALKQIADFVSAAWDEPARDESGLSVEAKEPATPLRELG